MNMVPVWVQQQSKRISPVELVLPSSINTDTNIHHSRLNEEKHYIKDYELTWLFPITIIATTPVTHSSIPRKATHGTHRSLELWVVQFPLLFLALLVDFPVDLVYCLGIVIFTTRFPPSFAQINYVLDHKSYTIWYLALINNGIQSAKIRIHGLAICLKDTVRRLFQCSP